MYNCNINYYDEKKLVIMSDNYNIIKKCQAYFGIIYKLIKDSNHDSWKIKIECDGIPEDKTKLILENTVDNTLQTFEHNIQGYMFNGTWYLDVDKKWLLYIDRDKKNIIIWTSNPNEAFIITRKIIREITKHELKRLGTIAIHSSAIEYNNNAIIFCGDKGDGKTTTLLNLLNTKRFKFISNDLSVLTTDNIILPVASGVNVGLGTLYGIENYHKLIPNKYQKLLVDEKYREENKFNKFYFDLEDFVDLFDVEVSKGAPLKSIIFVKFNLNNSGWSIKRMSNCESEYNLRRNMILEDEDHHDWLKLSTDNNLELDIRVNDILKKVKCYELKFDSSGIDFHMFLRHLSLD